MQTNVSDLDQHARLKARVTFLEQQVDSLRHSLATERSANTRIRAERDLYLHDLAKLIRAIERLNETEEAIIERKPAFELAPGAVALIGCVALIVIVTVALVMVGP